MNFGHFAQMLYPFIGSGQNKADFVLVLVEQIMSEPTTENDKALDDEDLYYPLEKKTQNTLEAYFSGKRDITDKIASAILMRLDTARFIDYLLGLNPELLKMFEDSLRHVLAVDDVVTYCTDLFVSILKNCANIEDTLTVKSDIASESLSEQIERLKHENIFNEGHELFNLAKKDSRVAEQLRKMFTQHDSGCRIENYTRGDIEVRIEKSDEDLCKDSINDIENFLQTIYESCVENETYEETLEFFGALNDYIEVSCFNTASDSSDEISDLRNKVIALLNELDVLY